MTSREAKLGRALACALSIVLVSAYAWAEPKAEDFVGSYSFNQDGISRSAVISPYEDDVIKLELNVNTGQCTGQMEGYGGIEGGKLIVTPPTQDDTCEIAITQTGSGIAVRETKCLNWHGASCNFSAKLDRD